MKRNIGFIKKFILPVLCGFALTPLAVFAATTIGTNIATNGSLTVDGSVKFTNGAGAGYILQSDGTGNASWLDASAWDKNAANDLTTATAFSGDVSGSYNSTVVSDLTIAGQAAGDVLYFDGTNWVRLAIGANGQVLTLSGGLPSWAAVSYTETDPVFGASAAAGIVAGDITNWNTAFSWGNHALAGYLTSESDPIWVAAEPNYGNLGQAETIVGNWVNTANPWADNEVAALSGGVQGDILYHNGTNWTALAPGVAGQYLQTQGAGANPQWAAVPAVLSGTTTDSILRWSGAAWVEDTNVLATAAGNLTANGDLDVLGNTTLGDASGDTLTFNASTLSIPNNLNIDSDTLYVDASTNRVGVGITTPNREMEIKDNSSTTTVPLRVTNQLGDGEAGVELVGGPLASDKASVVLWGSDIGASTVAWQQAFRVTLYDGTPGGAGSMIERLRILGNNGYVGIGTANPNGMFEVYAPTGNDATILLSNDDVSHGMTDELPTHTFGSIGPKGTAEGTLDIVGASDADVTALLLTGYVGVTNPTSPVIAIKGGKKSGTGKQALASGETLMTLLNDSSQIQTVLGNGDTSYSNGTNVFAQITPDSGSDIIGLTGSRGILLSDPTTGVMWGEFARVTHPLAGVVNAFILKPTVTDGGGAITITDSSSNDMVILDTFNGYGEISMAAGDGKYTAIHAAATQDDEIAYTLPQNDGNAGQVLSTDGSGVLSWAAASGTPGGADTNVQYNDGSSFGGDGNFTWNKTSKQLIVTTDQNNASFAAARTGVANGSNVAVAGFSATPASGSIGSMITISNGSATGFIMMDQLNKLGFGIIGSTGAAYIDASNNFYLPAALKILESGGSPQYYTNITAGDQSGDISYTLPTGYPAADGYVLQSTTGGTMSWAAPATGTVGGTGTAGQAAFWTGANALSGDNGFVWDGVNSVLAVNAASVNGSLAVGPTIGLNVTTSHTADVDNQDLYTAMLNPTFDDNGHSGVRHIALNVQNGDLIMRTGTKIGIGAPTPSYAIDMFNGEKINFNPGSWAGALFGEINDAFEIDAKGDYLVLNATNPANVGIGTATPGSTLDVKGELRLSGSTSGYVGLAPAAAAGSTTYTLPTADGTSGQILSTNGSGVLSWATNNSLPAGTTTDSILRWSGAAWVENTNVLATAAGNLTANGDLDVLGNTTLGDASGDTLTFNASTLSLPNSLNIDSDTLYVDAAANRVGIGTNTPNYPLEVHLAADKNVFIGNGVDVPTAVTIGSINDANSGHMPLEFRATEYHFQLGRIYTNDGLSVNNSTLSPAAGILIATVAANQNFVIQGGQGLPTGVAISAINDLNNANVPMEFRGNKYYFDSGDVGIHTTSPGSALDVKGEIRLSGATSGYVGFAPAAAAGSTTYTLPTADGTSGQVLTTDGSGTLSWVSNGAGTGNVFTALNLTDNALVRGDGGTTGVQTTGITVDDSDNLNTGGNITVDGTHYIKLGMDYISSGGANFTIYGYNAWFDGGSWYIPDAGHASVINTMDDVDGFVLWETTSFGSTDFQWRFSVSPQGNVAIGRPVNTNTPNFYQYGYVTSALTSKYVAFTLLTNGYYALQRQDASVNGFNINMPLGIQETGVSPTYHTYFQGGDQAADVTYTLPIADGSAGQILSTNGSGVLSWATNGDITAVGSMTSGDVFASAAADNNWLGLGSGAGRIEFDDQAIDEVNILDANVGIGTSTPADKVSIETNANDNGRATITNLSGGTDATAEFQVHNDGGEVGTMAATSTGYTTVTGAADMFAVIGLNKNSFFGTYLGGDVAIGRIIGATMNKDIYIPSATGNVGVGTVSPATKFHVLGYTTIDATDVVAAFSSSDATRRVNIGYDVAGDFGEISAVQTGTGWKNLILARYAGGNVGIRTTSPDTTLDVGGDIRIESSNKLYFGGTGSGDILGNLSHDGTDFVLSDDLKLNTQSGLKFADADSSNWVAFKAPTTVSANVTWTLPAADGTSGQVLSTNGSGTLSWAANNSLPTGTTTDSTLRWNGSAWVENTNFKVDANGFLTLGVSVWDDVRVPVTATTRQGTQDPTFTRVKDDGAGSQGVFAYLFNQTTEEELYFTLEVPTTYKSGTTIYPHVHWAPTTAGAGNVVWGLEYTWVNVDGTFGNTTLSTVTDSTDSTADKHLEVEFAGISGTGKTGQSMLICRVYRKAADAADTYAASAALFNIDFDFEIDKLGTSSRP